MNDQAFSIDDHPVPFRRGESIMEAALRAGVYIPHLCYHPLLEPHGSCRLCTVEVNGKPLPACTTPAAAGLEVANDTEALNQRRRTLLQLLFAEGNHCCPSCEKSGHCELQAMGYWLKMLDSPFPYLFPRRTLDASHPAVLLDRDRCIFCERCVRASRKLDGKDVFALAGRGLHTRLVVNSPSGRLGDSDLEASDHAARICPTGALLVRGEGFRTPIGKRPYDRKSLAETCLQRAAALLEGRKDRER